MKVRFKTNLDKYRSIRDIWPTLPDRIIPRIGESIRVEKEMITYFANRGLPTELEVVDVTYTEDEIEVELHYKKHDVELRDKNVLF